MSDIVDFTAAEIQVVRDTLKERFKEDKELQQADTELRLNPDSSTMTSCPTLYFTHEGCHFIICKIGKQRFFCQFFYGTNDQYGTGRQEYDDILDCITTLLRVQADHQLQKEGAKKA